MSGLLRVIFDMPLDLTLVTGKHREICIVERPGLWMTESQLAALCENLKTLASTTLPRGAGDFQKSVPRALLAVVGMAFLAITLQRIFLPAIRWFDTDRGFGILRPGRTRTTLSPACPHDRLSPEMFADSVITLKSLIGLSHSVRQGDKSGLLCKQVRTRLQQGPTMLLNAHHHYPSRRSAVVARNVVATSQPLAAQAGLSMLARGGNAADAALATAIALTVLEPTGNGLGSDAFCILWDGKQLHGLNASGRAPQGWSPDYFKGHDMIPFHGWDSVTVPGAVSAWVELSERFGKLPFEILFEPAIGYAEAGFPVSPVIAKLWARGAASLADQPGFAANFLRHGRAPLAGEIYANPDLAHSLRLIAETRGRAFYQGDLAEKIEAFAIAHGAAMRVADLAAHQADWCGTIHKGFDDVTLHEIPPNGQGIAGLMALGMLDHTNIRDLDADDPRALHLQIEAMKLALRDAESYVADIDHMTRVTPEALLDHDYLATRAQLIDPERATDFKTGKPPARGTVYLSAADAAGMMVSFIQSNYAGFGSGVTVPGTGIHLQNRGAGFSLDPKSQNLVAPGKRPFHTIIPAFLMKGDAPLMSFGVMGGPMQAQGHLQMTLRTQLWKQDVQMAVDAPRWRATGGLGLACETSFPEATLQHLSDMGHAVEREAPDNAFGFGGAQLIARLESGVYAAGSDPRKDGQAVGF